MPCREFLTNNGSKEAPPSFPEFVKRWHDVVKKQRELNFKKHEGEEMAIFFMSAPPDACRVFYTIAGTCFSEELYPPPLWHGSGHLLQLKKSPNAVELRWTFCASN